MGWDGDLGFWGLMVFGRLWLRGYGGVMIDMILYK